MPQITHYISDAVATPFSFETLNLECKKKHSQQFVGNRLMNSRKPEFCFHFLSSLKLKKLSELNVRGEEH